MRTRLPDGSRNAQSRAPHGCDTGSWSTSAPDARTFSNVASRSSERKIAACSDPCVTSVRRASPSACERPPCGWDRTMSTSWPGAPTVTQRKPSDGDVVADLEAERVAVEAERGVGVVDGDEHCGDGDCHATTVRAPTRRVLLRSCSVSRQRVRP